MSQKFNSGSRTPDTHEKKEEKDTRTRSLFSDTINAAIKAGEKFLDPSKTDVSAPTVSVAPRGPDCYVGHPPVTFPGFVGYGVIRGGRASDPQPGYDIYVDLDSPGQVQQAPWRAKNGTVLVRYEIPNFKVPTDPVSFKLFIDWFCTQVQNGKRVHVGCIGGHGRTGLVIAAVVKQLTGNKDAIIWTRENYCKKAVETDSQVAFLVKHYECNPTTSRYGDPTSSKGKFPGF